MNGLRRDTEHTGQAHRKRPKVPWWSPPTTTLNTWHCLDPDEPAADRRLGTTDSPGRLAAWLHDLVRLLPAFATSTSTLNDARRAVAGRRGDQPATSPWTVQCASSVSAPPGAISHREVTAGEHRDRVGSCRLGHRSRGTGAVTIRAANRVAWMVRARIRRSQTWASAGGSGSRLARSQSTVRLMPSVRSVSGFQPSTRPARVGFTALA